MSSSKYVNCSREGGEVISDQEVRIGFRQVRGLPEPAVFFLPGRVYNISFPPCLWNSRDTSDFETKSPAVNCTRR